MSGDDIPVLTGGEIRRLPERRALVIAENGRPIIAKLHRCIDGPRGRQLLADQKRLRDQLTAARRLVATPEATTERALAEARRRGLTPDDHPKRAAVSGGDGADGQVGVDDSGSTGYRTNLLLGRFR